MQLCKRSINISDSRDSGWCEDNEDSNDREDGSDTDELESLPTPIIPHPFTWSSKQSTDSGKENLDLVLSGILNTVSLQSSVSKAVQHSTTVSLYL